MRIPILKLSATLCLLLLIGCADNGASSVPPTMTAVDAENVEAEAVPKAVPARGERQALDGLKFIVPDSWQQVELSEFQKGIVSARFEMPDAGPNTTLTLSRSGGGVEANLSRWKGQVTNKTAESVEEVSVAGVDAKLLDQTGRFSGGFGKPAADGWRMMGVIVPLSDQGYFIKLTGPIEEVAAVEEQFQSFLSSAAIE